MVTIILTQKYYIMHQLKEKIKTKNENNGTLILFRRNRYEDDEDNIYSILEEKIGHIKNKNVDKAREQVTRSKQQRNEKHLVIACRLYNKPNAQLPINISRDTKIF